MFSLEEAIGHVLAILGRRDGFFNLCRCALAFGHCGRLKEESYLGVRKASKGFFAVVNLRGNKRRGLYLLVREPFMMFKAHSVRVPIMTLIAGSHRRGSPTSSYRESRASVPLWRSCEPPAHAHAGTRPLICEGRGGEGDRRGVVKMIVWKAAGATSCCLCLWLPRSAMLWLFRGVCDHQSVFDVFLYDMIINLI